MKKRLFANLLAVILCLSLSTGLAFSVTNLEIKYPIFSLEENALQLSLVSNEKEQVENENANLVLKFDVLGSEIKTDDIKTLYPVFYIKTTGGREYQPVMWRVRGVDFSDGNFSTHEYQKGFEFLYQIDPTDENPFESLSLSVGEKGAVIRLFVQILPSENPAGTEAPAAPLNKGNDKSHLPSEVSFAVGNNNYTVSVLSIEKNDDGKTSLKLSGLNGDLRLVSSGLMPPVLVSIVVDGQELSANSFDASKEFCTFHFDTDKDPENIFVYPFDDDSQKTEIKIKD